MTLPRLLGEIREAEIRITGVMYIAEDIAGHQQQTVDGRVILALGGKLTHDLASVADLLDVEVVENIGVPAAFAAKARAATSRSA
jgi:hypothetical protein